MATSEYTDFSGKAYEEDAPELVEMPSLPAELGPLQCFEPDFDSGKKLGRKSLPGLWMSVSGLPGIGLGLALWKVIGLHGGVSGLVGLLAAGAGVGMAYSFTRRFLKFWLVGKNGVAERTYLNSVEKLVKERKLKFVENLHFFFTTPRRDHKVLGEVMDFKAVWVKDREIVFSIGDKFMTSAEDADKEAGWDWAKAAEKSWTAWQIDHTPEKENRNTIRFEILNLGPLEISREKFLLKPGKEKVMEWAPEDLKRVVLRNEKVILNFTKGDLNFAQQDFGNLEYFKWLVNDWFGTEVRVIGEGKKKVRDEGKKGKSKKG